MNNKNLKNLNIKWHGSCPTDPDTIKVLINSNLKNGEEIINKKMSILSDKLIKIALSEPVRTCEYVEFPPITEETYNVLSNQEDSNEDWENIKGTSCYRKK